MLFGIMPQKISFKKAVKMSTTFLPKSSKKPKDLYTRRYTNGLW